MSYKKRKQKACKQRNALNVVQEEKAKSMQMGNCFKSFVRKGSKRKDNGLLHKSIAGKEEDL